MPLGQGQHLPNGLDRVLVILPDVRGSGRQMEDPVIKNLEKLEKNSGFAECDFADVGFVVEQNSDLSHLAVTLIQKLPVGASISGADPKSAAGQVLDIP